MYLSFSNLVNCIIVSTVTSSMLEYISSMCSAVYIYIYIDYIYRILVLLGFLPLPPLGSAGRG